MKHPQPTLVHKYLALSAEKFPDKTALVCGKDRVNYAQLNCAASSLAKLLVKSGVRPRDRVVILLDNSIEAVIALYAVLKAGGTFVILNSTTKPPKLAYILKDSGATALITSENKLATTEASTADTPDKPIMFCFVENESGKALSSHAVYWHDRMEGLLDASMPGTESEAENDVGRITHNDLAALIYTSGSTGEPKGVMSSHHNMLSAARSIITYLENTPDDVIINVMPMSFDYGLYQIIMSVMFGGTVVIERSFLYPVMLLESIQTERVTGFPIVPTVAAYLLRMKNLDRFDLSSLRYITSTGAALPEEHIRELRKLFPDVRFYSMFGLTECKRVSYLPPEQIDTRPGSVGKAMPDCEVYLVDDDGEEVGPGEVGEMVVRGPNVMQGYWNDPEITSRTFRSWRFPDEKVLFTGDYFRTDSDGFLYFLGRRDDMIKTKAERVSPKEVENVLCQMEGIIEAAVIGVEDELMGQAVKACVRFEDGVIISEKDILRHCSESLEAYMIPKYMEVLADFPRTPNGKVDKKALMNPRPHCEEASNIIQNNLSSSHGTP